MRPGLDALAAKYYEDEIGHVLTQTVDKRLKISNTTASQDKATQMPPASAEVWHPIESILDRAADEAIAAANAAQAGRTIQDRLDRVPRRKVRHEFKALAAAQQGVIGDMHRVEAKTQRAFAVQPNKPFAAAFLDSSLSLHGHKVPRTPGGTLWASSENSSASTAQRKASTHSFLRESASEHKKWIALHNLRRFHDLQPSTPTSHGPAGADHAQPLSLHAQGTRGRDSGKSLNAAMSKGLAASEALARSFAQVGETLEVVGAKGKGAQSAARQQAQQQAQEQALTQARLQQRRAQKLVGLEQRGEQGLRAGAMPAPAATPKKRWFLGVQDNGGREAGDYGGSEGDDSDAGVFAGGFAGDQLSKSQVRPVFVPCHLTQLPPPSPPPPPSLLLHAGTPTHAHQHTHTPVRRQKPPS